MKCTCVHLPDGGTAIVCSSGRRRRCAYCHREAVKLCDGPPRSPRRKTCSRPVCEEHAEHLPGAGLDYCLQHKEEAMRQRHSGPLPIGDLFQRSELLAQAQAIAAAKTAIQKEAPHATAAGKAGPTPNPAPAEPPPPPAPADPAPNSPADVGYVEQERPTGHLPKICSSCSAPIYWAQNPNTGRSMPVDVTPTADGTVVLYDRDGSVVYRLVKKDDPPRPGEKRRKPHWASCPFAKRHRRGGRR